jgi:minor extracellular serine protease Vpr
LLSQAALSTTDSPGDAPLAIAVAATTNSHSWGNSLTVSGLGTYHARFGDGPLPAATVNGSLGDVAIAGDPLACTAPPAGSLNGLIALVRRGTCTFALKIQNLQIAGAAGAIISNNAGDDTLLSPSGLNGTTIPTAFIGYDDGETIRTYLKANSRVTVSIAPDFSPFDITTYNQVAPFSSHGPTLGSGALKPDVAAVGVDLYLAGQTYDPNGELYSASGYLVSQGTSFSTPQVAGVAALVKQAWPGLSAIQLQSAVVNTATQDITENGNTASILAVGAGKVNAGSAVANNLIVTPPNASFGTLTTGTLPLTQQFQLTNIGTAALNLSVSITRRTPEVTAQTSINRPNLTIAPGQMDNISLMLSGTLPAPGIYEGFVTITGAANPVNIPYLYIVGDGVPQNIISMAGNGDDGGVGQQSAGGYIILQVIDQYGVAVPGLPVKFSVASGGGQLTPIANATDNYGIAAAKLVLGPNPGSNAYTATAGTLTASFQAIGLSQPVITPNGAVNAANYVSQPPAPGSYISLFGTNFAATTASYGTPYLPVSLNQVSVSFDNPNVSVPGHLVFVSPGQVNVQVPWELQGQPSVQIKVSVSDSSGLVYTIPLAAYSPALFEIPSGGQNIAASLDESNNIVTTSNPVARGHVVQLFGNGLGPVNNQPASGDPAPLSPLATTTSTPIVSIGGVSAQVSFSGMTPGNAALYQINAVVPDSAAGLQPVTISIGGVVSRTSLLPVK